MAKKARTPSK